MKKHLVILITAAVLVVAAVAGVMIFALSKGDSDSNDAPTWREQYDLGVRYLNSGNYEEAVIAFKAAIEIDPKKADAYLGLADAYIGLGDTEKAEDVLTDALDAVRSSDRTDIEAKLAELDPASSSGPSPDDPDSTDPPEPAHTHTWLDATCTEPRTCSECGATEGAPLGHDMLPATYDAPSTCSRCGHTEGEPLVYNITWTLEDGVLTISGTGPMRNYDVYSYYNAAPWYERSSEIENVIIENGVTSIGKYAFARCYYIKNVAIPDGVTTIGEDAFFDCENLTGVTIPSSVTYIGTSAFSSCSNLAEIQVDEENQNYVSVDGVLFNADMTSLYAYPAGKNETEYLIPFGVTTIDNAAFCASGNLISIKIPNTVTTIGASAFFDCENLTGVTIPSSVTCIYYGAFSSCSNLAEIQVDEENQNYVSVDGVLFSADMTSLHTYPAGKNETEYYIPFGVTMIEHMAFAYCGLTSITMPDSAVEIGDHAFAGCYNLTHITIPYGVASIGEWAFDSCYNLMSIAIPRSVTSIRRTFDGCYSLTDIYYSGTAEQWAAISAEATVPETATVHYSSER